MTTLGIIPARGGSQGIPRKNVRLFLGVPLVVRAWETAIRCRALDAVVVVTDDNEIEDVVSEVRLEYTLTTVSGVVRRPPGDGPMAGVVRWLLGTGEYDQYDTLAILQPTAPLRTQGHVTAGLELLRESGADSVVSVVPVPLTSHPEYVCHWSPDGRLRPWRYSHFGDTAWDGALSSRQSVGGPVYTRDGTLYACTRHSFDTHGHLYGVVCRPLIMTLDESAPLDEERDWAYAEWLATRGRNGGGGRARGGCSP